VAEAAIRQPHWVKAVNRRVGVISTVQQIRMS